MNHIIAPCALRTHRRTWGLTQRELAELLGFESPTHVSRLEHGKRVPGLETALFCATLFGASLGDLFPQVAAEAESYENVSRFQGPINSPVLRGKNLEASRANDEADGFAMTRKHCGPRDPRC
jgi:transcriptional regulator with XRE-family HTH domain